MAIFDLKANIDHFAKDKTWYFHIPLWLFGLLVFVQLIRFDIRGALPVNIQIPYSFDFMLHEVAHIVTAWMPPIMTAAAGSISELLLGGLLIVGAFWFRNYFASMFCCLWAMLACQSAGQYMADAIPQEIPLVSLGGALSGTDTALHDWHFVFGQLHLLGASAFIGWSVRVVGILIGLFGLIFAAWLMYKMAVASKKPMSQDDLAQLKAEAAGQPAPPSKPKPIYPTPVRGSLVDRDADAKPKQGDDSRQ